MKLIQEELKLELGTTYKVLIILGVFLVASMFLGAYFYVSLQKKVVKYGAGRFNPRTKVFEIWDSTNKVYRD